MSAYARKSGIEYPTSKSPYQKNMYFLEYILPPLDLVVFLYNIHELKHPNLSPVIGMPTGGYTP